MLASCLFVFQLLNWDDSKDFTPPLILDRAETLHHLLMKHSAAYKENKEDELQRKLNDLANWQRDDDSESDDGDDQKATSDNDISMT